MECEHFSDMVYAFIDDFVQGDKIESPEFCEAILKKVVANVRKNDEKLKPWSKVKCLRCASHACCVAERQRMRQSSWLKSIPYEYALVWSCRSELLQMRKDAFFKEQQLRQDPNALKQASAHKMVDMGALEDADLVNRTTRLESMLVCASRHPYFVRAGSKPPRLLTASLRSKKFCLRCQKLLLTVRKTTTKLLTIARA
eukprot:SAG11_NODE_13014_length_674_cov_0.714783_1_plen_199_part_01